MLLLNKNEGIYPELCLAAEYTAFAGDGTPVLHYSTVIQLKPFYFLCVANTCSQWTQLTCLIHEGSLGKEEMLRMGFKSLKKVMNSSVMNIGHFMLNHRWLIQEHKEAMITWHCRTGDSHTCRCGCSLPDCLPADRDRGRPQWRGSADWTPEFQFGCVTLVVPSFVVDWAFSGISCATYISYMDQTSSFSRVLIRHKRSCRTFCFP